MSVSGALNPLGLFDHGSYDQCKKKHFVYQSIRGLFMLSVKKHLSTTDNFDCRKAAE